MRARVNSLSLTNLGPRETQAKRKERVFFNQKGVHADMDGHRVNKKNGSESS